jgi:hypothetical protein
MLALLVNRERRIAFGVAARERALMQYAWTIIVARYEELWKHLADNAHPVDKVTPRLALDAFDPELLFGHYATQIVSEDNILRLGRSAMADNKDAIIEAATLRWSNKRLTEDILHDLEHGVFTGQQLYAKFGLARQIGTKRFVSYLCRLAKYGLIEFDSVPL